VVALGGGGYLIGLLIGGLSDDPHHQRIAGLFGSALGALAGAVVPLRSTRVLYEISGC
jgi:hypothetical protein